MWFYPVLLALVILAIVGGTLAGGIFTIVLVPLAGVAFVSALVYALWGRALQGESRPGGEGGRQTDPLPHQRTRPSGHTHASPQQLADARRQQQ